MSEYGRQVTTHVSLPWLARMAETGELRPAAFSRPQVWDSMQVAQLFDSIFHGYPIGALLVVGQSVPEEDYLLGNIHITAPRSDHAWVIIDGLQRIAAIVGALSAKRTEDKNDQFGLFFDPWQETFEAGPPVHPSSLPLYIAVNWGRLTDWLNEHPFPRKAEADSCWRLYEALNSYSVPMIQLDGEDARENAGIIFTRINASGASLTKSDRARARASQISVTEHGLERLQVETERLAFGNLPTDLAAECALAVLSQAGDAIRPRSTRTTAEKNFEQLPESLREHAIDRARKAMVPAIHFLRQEISIPHIRLLPQGVTLIYLIKFFNTYGPPTGRAQELLRRWVWRYGTVSADLVRQSSDLSDWPESAIRAATNLLDSLSSSAGPMWSPDTYALDLMQADGRLNTLGLLSQRPPLLVATENLNDLKNIAETTDVPISSAQILVPWLDSSDSAFCQFLPSKTMRGRRISLGGCLLHPPADGEDLWNSVMSQASGPTDRLAAHSIDGTSLRLLSMGDFDQFIARRETQMTSIIRHHVQSRARWGFRDHGNLPNIPDSPHGNERDDED